MRRDFLRFQLLLIGVLICFFRVSYAQIKVEQELMFNDDTLFVFNKNGQRGLGNDSNTVGYKYDSIILNHHNDMILAMKEGKWGTIGNDNQIRLPLKYDKLVPIFVSDDLIVAALAGKWGLINERGKKLIPFVYDTLAESSVIEVKGKSYRTFIVKKNGKFGIVNNKNKILFPLVYDEIMSRSEYGLNGYYVLVNGKKGFVNEEGRLIIPCIYDAINYNYNAKLFRIKQDNKYGLVNAYNKPFLPLTFTKLYLDIPFFDDETEDNTKIVVQKMDSNWQYLSVKDGGILQDNVPQDSVFKYYKTALFGAALMAEYLQKVQIEERTLTGELDTFYQRLISEIIASRSGIQIDFPDLHKTLINFIPDYRETRTISKIRNYMLSHGYEITMTGERMDDRATGQRLCFRISLPDRECLFEISLHKTFEKDAYKIIESLKCIEQNNSYMRIPRYHNLHRD